MKKLVGALIALVVILLGVSVGTHMLIDQKAVRNNLTQAFRDQSGLELRMDQALFQILPWPSFHASNVLLTRPGCTPFIVARSVHADISLLALLHRELSFQDFTVEGAQVTFHRTREGKCSSWLPFRTDDASENMAGQPHDKPLRARWKIVFEALHMSDAQVSWQDDHYQGEKQRGGFTVASLDMMGMRSEGPWIDLKAQHGQTPFRFRGRIGSTHRILSSSVKQDTPWGFSFGLTFGPEESQDQMVMDGTMMDPHRVRGVRVSVQGHWSDLRDLEGLFPHIGLPDVSHVNGMVDLRERENAETHAPQGFLEAIRELPSRLYPVQLHLQLGNVAFPQGTLGVEAPLHLRDLQMDGDASLAPLTIQGNADWGRFSWIFHAHLQSLEQSVAAWEGTGHGSVPLSVQIQGRDRTLAALFTRKDSEPAVAQDGVHLEVDGRVGRHSSELSAKGGADMLQLPELPGIGQELSGTILHNLSLQSVIKTGPFSQHGLETIDLKDVHFDSREIGGTGEFSLAHQEHMPTRVDGMVHLSHLDGESLRGLGATADKEQKDATAMAMHHRDGDDGDDKQTSEDPVKAFFNRMHTRDIQLDLLADQVHLQGLDYHDVHMKLAVKEGRLLLDPITGQLDGVPLMARVVLDDTHSPAHLHVEAAPFIVPSAVLFQLLGQPSLLRGPIQWDGVLDAQGTDQESMLRSLNGTLGLSLVKGDIQTSVLAPLAGPAAAFLKLSEENMGLRCAAMHMNLEKGQGVVDTLGMHNKHISLRGYGKVNLVSGALSLKIQPRFTLVGNSFSVPMTVEGPWLSPQVTSQDMGDGQKQLSVDATSDAVDPCQSLIQKARDGHAGLPIPEMPDGHSGTGGFLKALGLGGK